MPVAGGMAQRGPKGSWSKPLVASWPMSRGQAVQSWTCHEHSAGNGCTWPLGPPLQTNQKKRTLLFRRSLPPACLQGSHPSFRLLRAAGTQDDIRSPAAKVQAKAVPAPQLTLLGMGTLGERGHQLCLLQRENLVQHVVHLHKSGEKKQDKQERRFFGEWKRTGKKTRKTKEKGQHRPPVDEEADTGSGTGSAGAGHSS